MGLDVGTKRVGVAVSDPLGSMSFPRQVLPNDGTEALVARLVAFMDAEGVEAVVMGLPRTRDGADTALMHMIKNLAKRLHQAGGRPVDLHDESFSSDEAKSQARAAGVFGKKAKKDLDAHAAAVILDSYLAAARRNARPHELPDGPPGA